MTSDVVLSAALRTNLLALQNTQSSIDKVQNSLATGLKVSSALDNPQNFFAAQSLRDRASDLSSLLDSQGQSIQTIKAADKGTAALSKLLDQAESLASEASTVTADSASGAQVTGNVDLRDVSNVTSVSGIANTNYVEFYVTDPDGATQKSLVTFDANYGDGGANRVTFNSYESIDNIIQQIDNLRDSTSGNRVLDAKLDENGFLQISTLNGGDLRIVFDDGGGEANALANALGFSEQAREHNEVDQLDAAGYGTANLTALSVVASPVISSFNLFDQSTDAVATRSTTLNNLASTAGGSANELATLVNSDTELAVGINGGTAQVVIGVGAAVASTNVQDYIDAINANTTLNKYIKADFDETTGQITIRATSADAKSVQFYVNDTLAANNSSFNLGFGLDGFTSGLDLTASASVDANEATDSESVFFGKGAGRLAQIESDYAGLLGQIDTLVADANYRGVNLLTGDTLETTFNEDRTATLQTVGQDLTSKGLGLNAASFTSTSNISSALTEIRSAKATVRNFGSALANSLSIIQIRQDYTTDQVNTLKEGADKLTVADQNEEGAKLLALQTRQQLGVVTLSLASQSQQAVLRLF